ncbi:MAG: NADH-ubiquinone oxidoreductase-F iron-sulfur binding region domain-containing protein [Pirellulaceae bacterium]
MNRHWLIPNQPYSSYGAYQKSVGENAIRKAQSLSPQTVIRMIEESGLRGRGGAGFPTSRKWRTLFEHPCKRRFVVCNAAEGEPGTFKDRFLLKKNPFSTLEGMLIAAHVVGATRLFIALKASFREELEHVHNALREIHAAGLFGGRRFTVVEGPEEYLFGEEKALLNVIDGPGPLPREAHYPPYELGLYSTPGSPNPALVNNAETFAHVPNIIRDGPQAFRKLGSADTPGTIISTISGQVKRPGVYECEAGMPLAELFNHFAGGPLAGRTFKAAICGVSNGVIPAHRFDTPADFGSLRTIGSGLGSAGFVVFDDSTSMPRVAQAMARFLYVESCNQCTACKYGLRMASTALDELLDRTHRPGAYVLDRILAGVEHAPQGNRCYLPVQASLLIPSIIREFRTEFEALCEEQELETGIILPPKMVDYDEQRHRFAYDRLQVFKNPDWTYSPPAGLVEAPATGKDCTRSESDTGDTLMAGTSQDSKKRTDEFRTASFPVASVALMDQELESLHKQRRALEASILRHKQHTMILRKELETISRRIREVELDLQREASMEGGE